MQNTLNPRWLAATLGMLLSGCAGMLPAPTPLRSIDYPAASQPAKCLFVLLPGAGDHAETFEQRGFVEALRSRSLSIDVRATDATIGYYMRGIMLERFTTDVIAPTKSRGYQETWLVGPSMGGSGSLFYSRAHTSDITGVLSIAPFLGDRSLIKEIANAGGLDKWQAPARVDAMDADNYQREMWRWFQATSRGQEPAPLMFLGYGSDDSLGTAAQLLTAKLPASRVFVTNGGHEWPAWRRVLESFLDSPDFASHCRADAPAAAATTPAETGALDSAACQARGGQVRPVCRRQLPRCVIRYADAGKQCTDKSQCQGMCLVDGGRPLETGEVAQGRCQEDDDPCGCKIEVKNGKVAGGRCVD